MNNKWISNGSIVAVASIKHVEYSPRTEPSGRLKTKIKCISHVSPRRAADMSATVDIQKQEIMKKRIILEKDYHFL